MTPTQRFTELITIIPTSAPVMTARQKLHHAIDQLINDAETQWHAVVDWIPVIGAITLWLFLWHVCATR